MIILASASPRRKELLQAIDIPFIVDSKTSFNEVLNPNINLKDMPLYMAEGKAEGFYRALNNDEILISADTMVLCDNQILGKPKVKAQAVEMLNLLSGKTHSVITGVHIKSNDVEVSFSEETLVTFKPLCDEEIIYYVDKYKPYDKAGAYGIQEWIGLIGIVNIEGSYFNVMGLPVDKVYSVLKNTFKV